MSKNIITILFDSLHVPYTKGFTLKALQTEPFGNTFYGLASLLARYGINTRSVKVMMPMTCRLLSYSEKNLLYCGQGKAEW